MVNEQQIENLIKQNPYIDFLNLAKKAKIKIQDNKKLTQILFRLKDAYRITEPKKGFYVALEHSSDIKGVLKFVQEGKFAFIDLENSQNISESYFVPKNEFNGAINNDLVSASVYKMLDKDKEKQFAAVKKVLERSVTQITGIYEKGDKFPIFKPINKIYNSLKFKVLGSEITVESDDIVLAQIVDNKNGLTGIKFIKKISSTSNPMGFVQALISEKNVPSSFPKEVMDHAHFIPDEIANENQSERLDLRNELIVTIDGNDTKDFDDAINVKQIDENTYELGVHIADVSHYVHENDPIDIEALNRGTSIYLMDRVIPMLPEKLSNGICSLNPNVDRFTMSIIMKIDKEGNTLSADLKQTIINSKYRLTYDRVNEFINENKKFEDENLNQMLEKAVALAKIIRNFKNNQGYIDFEIVEPYIKLDENGKVIDILTKATGFAENLIEDFMVRANEEVAKYLTRHKFPAMYRIHEKPSEEKLDYFISVLNELNINVNIDRNKITPKSFQKIINAIKEQRHDEFLKILFLRTMSKAIYAAENIGHFGLASEDYCHFTSPIRRYPDLVIHRIIRDLVLNKKLDRISHYKMNLPLIAQQNSNSEQNAVQIERDTNDLKYAEYWNSRIGQIIKGQVVSIQSFGMFVEFSNKTEAMVHISNMCDTPFETNELKTELISENKKIKLGDFVDVVIIGADIANGKVDAALANCPVK